MSEVYDHTSVIRTLCKRWDLEPLTERDRNARSFEAVLNSPVARQDEVKVNARPYEIPGNVREEPLNDLQRAILYLAAGFDDALQMEQEASAMKKAEDLLQLVKDENRISHIKTTGQAIEFLTAFAGRRRRRESAGHFFRRIWNKIRG